MKKLILYFLFLNIFVLLSCSSADKQSETQFKTVDDITDNMLCESCEKPLIKNISTIHIAKMENGDIHKYCSLNCLAKDWNTLENNAEDVLVMDAKFKRFFPAKDAHYVIRDTFGKSKKQITAYAYENAEYAQRFMKDFWGREIVYFKDAIKIINTPSN